MRVELMRQLRLEIERHGDHRCAHGRQWRTRSICSSRAGESAIAGEVCGRGEAGDAHKRASTREAGRVFNIGGIGVESSCQKRFAVSFFLIADCRSVEGGFVLGSSLIRRFVAIGGLLFLRSKHRRGL